MLHEHEVTLLKEMPDDNRQLLRDEIGLLIVREHRLMKMLNKLAAACQSEISETDKMEMMLRTHAELTSISAKKLRVIILIHLMDIGMDSLEIEQWRSILGGSDNE